MASAQQTYAPGTGVNASPPSAAQQARPFCQASKHGQQQSASFSQIITTGSTQLGPVSLTASGGFQRRVTLEITSATGAGASTPGPDYPFALLSKIRYSEPNNTPIFELSGFNTLLADIYGGYAVGGDPRNDPDYKADPLGLNPALTPYIPIELDATGLGALSDLSASSGYQLTLFTTPSGNAQLYSSAPASTLPTLTIAVNTEYWTLPNQYDMNGRQQETVPPFAGTVQLWNEIPNVSLPSGGGSSRQQLNRMGNQIRTVIMVTRANGPRSDVPFPNPLLLRWDDVVLRNQSPSTLRKYFREMTENALPQSRDVGVHVFPFSFGIGRTVGGNGVSSYLPTVTDTRFELSGTFGSATSPTLDWIINDVSSAPLSGVERTTMGTGPGYQPGVLQRTAGPVM